MGDGLTVLMAIGIAFSVWAIGFGIWIFVSLYKANKREARLTCSCGKRVELYHNDTDRFAPKQYAYMCSCGVRGYIGTTKEDAFYGWDLRGNSEAYLKYLTAKHGG